MARFALDELECGAGKNEGLWPYAELNEAEAAINRQGRLARHSNAVLKDLEMRAYTFVMIRQATPPLQLEGNTT